jgi:hypothetical protein
VHPASSLHPRASRRRQLLPGDPAAHGPDRLPLLPSGPDGVWQGSVAQDLTINAAFPKEHIQRWKTSDVEFDPAIADCGLQGTATSPSSTTNETVASYPWRAAGYW